MFQKILKLFRLFYQFIYHILQIIIILLDNIHQNIMKHSLYIYLIIIIAFTIFAQCAITGTHVTFIILLRIHFLA